MALQFVSWPWSSCTGLRIIRRYLFSEDGYLIFPEWSKVIAWSDRQKGVMTVMQRLACIKSAKESPDSVIHVLSENDLLLQIGVNKIILALCFQPKEGEWIDSQWSKRESLKAKTEKSTMLCWLGLEVMLCGSDGTHLVCQTFQYNWDTCKCISNVHTKRLLRTLQTATEYFAAPNFRDFLWGPMREVLFLKSRKS